MSRTPEECRVAYYVYTIYLSLCLMYNLLERFWVVLITLQSTELRPWDARVAAQAGAAAQGACCVDKRVDMLPGQHAARFAGKLLILSVAVHGMTTGPPLGHWHAAASRIPQESVLPLGFGSPSSEANVAAFLGDKLLGSAIALAQYETIGAAQTRGVGQLSELQGTASANRMLAAHLATLLPEHTNLSILELAEAQEHTAGTMVEAAVAAVHQQLGESESSAAIAEVAHAHAHARPHARSQHTAC